MIGFKLGTINYHYYYYYYVDTIRYRAACSTHRRASDSQHEGEPPRVLKLPLAPSR